MSHDHRHNCRSHGHAGRGMVNDVVIIVVVMLTAEGEKKEDEVREKA